MLSFITKPVLATVLSQMFRACRRSVLLFAARVADLNTDNHMKSKQAETPTLKKKTSVLRLGFKKPRGSCRSKEEYESRLPSARASEQSLSLGLDQTEARWTWRDPKYKTQKFQKRFSVGQTAPHL